MPMSGGGGQSRVKTHINTFGQVHVHIRHYGGTERPEPYARAWFVHVDKSGACVWSLVEGGLVKKGDLGFGKCKNSRC